MFGVCLGVSVFSVCDWESLLGEMRCWCRLVGGQGIHHRRGEIFEQTTHNLIQLFSFLHSDIKKLKQRVIGFATCFTIGYLMTFMSFRLFVKLVEGNPAPFVFLYSSGNIMSLMSSMFLSGPQKQFK